MELPRYFAMLKNRLGPGVNADFGSRYNKWVYGYRSERVYELIDQVAPWAKVEYRPMLWSREKVAAAARHRLFLDP